MQINAFIASLATQCFKKYLVQNVYRSQLSLSYDILSPLFFAACQKNKLAACLHSKSHACQHRNGKGTLCSLHESSRQSSLLRPLWGVRLKRRKSLRMRGAMARVGCVISSGLGVAQLDYAVPLVP